MKKTLFVTTSVIGLGVFFMGLSQVSAQEGAAAPVSVTIAPVEYAAVKGNVDKFREIIGIKDGANAGVDNLTFIKNINKDTSVDLQASGFTKIEDYDDHLVLRKGDLAFLRMDYKSFRKYDDNTGGVYRDNNFPANLSGAKANSPDLNLDINYFKLEAGLGLISDPDLDIIYEHDVKEGAKSLSMWGDATPSGKPPVKIAPSWEQISDTVDAITLKEKKEVAGLTIKADQRAEIDYNHNFKNSTFLTTDATAPGKLTLEEFPDTKIFSSGVRGEKWLFNNKTFATLGYHYDHTHTTDLFRNQEFDMNGTLSNNTSLYNPLYPIQSFWSYANNLEDQHVVYGNFNSSLTDNLDLAADLRYEHLGQKGVSAYLQNTGATPQSTPTETDTDNIKNQANRTAEHVALRYYGISRTSLYVEGDFQQERSWLWQALTAVPDPNSISFNQSIIDTYQKESWTVGGRTVLNRFFTLTTQVRQHWENNQYDYFAGNNPDLFLDALTTNGVEASSNLNWKPCHWFSNSLRYQFSDNIYLPRDASEGSGVPQYTISRNHMISSVFTNETTIQPMDPLLLVLSYSHVESNIRTIAASSNSSRIPTFNSGDNSFLFSASYAPTQNLSWINSAMYTLSNNYVDFSTGLPLGSSFKELILSTGIQWTVRKWLTIGPTYEYASYRDNPLVGTGNYSAHIIKLDVKFAW